MQAKEKLQRLGGLGASDAPVALGLSRWRSPLELFLEKTGHSDGQEETLPMQIGKALESVVLGLFEKRTRLKVRDNGVKVFDPRHAWRWVTLDGIASDNALVEAKTASDDDGWGEEGTDQMPLEYVVQTQHAMACTGLAVAWVPVLFQTRDFRLYQVARDDELIREMTAREFEFWQRVQNNDPPPAVSSSDLKLRYARDVGTSVVADAAILETLAALHVASKLQDESSEEAERLQTQVMAYMGEAATLVSPDGNRLATWKSVKPKQYIDRNALERDLPEVAAKYTRTAKPSRMFLLK